MKARARLRPALSESSPCEGRGPDRPDVVRLGRVFREGAGPLPSQGNSSHLNRTESDGFTLVEVVVALFIFAMLATAGVSLLSFTVRAQSASARVLEDVSGERRLSALLIGDLGQAVPRVSRDEAGRPRPAFEANRGKLLFAFVRGGAKPQHVEFRLEKGSLVRVATPFIDGAAGGANLVLQADVERAKLRFRTKSDWQDNWDAERSDAIPRALELTIVRRGAAPVTRMFLVGTGE